MQQLLYTNLIKNTSAYMQLSNDIESGNVAHSYMFVSYDDIALITLARLFSGEILNGSEAEKNLIYSGTHSDVKEKPNLNDEKKKSITVADIDELKKSLLVTPLRGDKKVYIIYANEGINPQSQNKLLKTLEEPPNNTYFIICCHQKSSVLPTISSRCKQIILKPFLESELTNALKSNYKNQEKIEFSVSASNGSLTASVNLLDSKKQNNLYDACIEILVNTQTSKDILTAVSKLVFYKDMLPLAINYIELILRDVLLINMGASNHIALKSNSEQLSRIATMYSAKAIDKLMPILNQARARIKTYGNVNSIVDKLVFNMVEYKAKYK